MTRLNLTLLVAVLISAFYLVHLQYESRRLYVALDKAKSQAVRLEADHEQLIVQKRIQATPSRVQKLAAEQLKMTAIHPGVTEYVTLGQAKVVEQDAAASGAVTGKVQP